MKRFLLPFAVCLAFLAQVSWARSTQEPGPETQIKDELDGVVRWMRAQQDRATGAYGDTATTAWVLWAMGESPRKYRAGDGVFVRGALDYLAGKQLDSGAFADAQGKADRGLTRLATRALFVHLDASRKPAYGKALAWLAAQGTEDGESDPLPDKLETEAARKHVRALLATCEDGHWNGADGPDLLQTAKNAVDLARYESMFREHGNDAPVVPLGPFTDADRDMVLVAMQRGAQFLVQAAEDGKYGMPGQPDAGLTVMVLGALQGMPQPRDPEVQAILDSGLDWMVSLQKPDGSIHQGRLANYVTSAAVLALSKSSKPSHQAAVQK
ncbi:MAG TPA: hypothetical protein P5218_15840, partial [Planctomycetota bacterium]|nr:hypothetical protein [Planctomycetota bacterium]